MISEARRERNRLACQRYRARQRSPAEAIVDAPGEEWRPIMGMEGLYAVSSLGRVKALAHELIREINTSPGKLWVTRFQEHLKVPYVGRNGYLFVNLAERNGSPTHAVHVVLCEAFHGPRPPGMMALHGNDERHDNRKENLRWGTPRENTRDAISNGRMPLGEDGSTAIFTNREAGAIRATAGVITPKHLATLLRCRAEPVRDIRQGRSYRNAPTIGLQEAAVILAGRANVDPAALYSAFRSNQPGEPIIRAFAGKVRDREVRS